MSSYSFTFGSSLIKVWSISIPLTCNGPFPTSLCIASNTTRNPPALQRVQRRKGAKNAQTNVGAAEKVHSHLERPRATRGAMRVLGRSRTHVAMASSRAFKHKYTENSDT